MPFQAPDGSENLVFMNAADQELYLVPSHLAQLFQQQGVTEPTMENPLVVAKYHLPGTNLKWYATSYYAGKFYGFVTGNAYPEWTEFSIEQWNEMARVYGNNILRDEEFSPCPFNDALPDSEKHLQGTMQCIQYTQEQTELLLNDDGKGYNTKTKTPSEIEQFKAEAERIRTDLHQEYGANPKLANALAEHWGAETNEHGVVVENLENLELVKNQVVFAEMNLYETKKGYWLYGLRCWLQTGSGWGYAPGVSQRTYLTTRDEAIQEAKAELVSNLEAQLPSLDTGSKARGYIQQALTQLKQENQQMDLF